MQKFGTSIRKQIEEISIRVILGTYRAQQQAKQHMKTEKVFMVPGLIGRS